MKMLADGIPDGIQASYLKKIVGWIGANLAYLNNVIIYSGTYPAFLAVDGVKPVYKEKVS